MDKALHVVELHDAKVGSSARIAAGLGFNCFSFQAAFAGERIETLWAAAGFDNGQQRPSSSGIPLLFPFAGRIAGGAFRWQGRDYMLEPNDGRGNAIHGFVHTRPWRVLELDAHHVRGQFQASRDEPRLRAFWPADFRITAEYALQGNTLRSRFWLENPDSSPLPFWFGTHPYFRLPLGGEDAADCLVQLPVSEEWELAELIPTGRRFPLRDTSVFQHGLRFGEMQFDNVFTGLLWDSDGLCRATIRDPSTQRRLTIAFDRLFAHCVVYTPPHREAVCIEPYTSIPNAPDLEATGVPTGLRVLEPGETLECLVEISVT